MGVIRFIASMIVLTGVVYAYAAWDKHNNPWKTELEEIEKFNKYQYGVDLNEQKETICKWWAKYAAFIQAKQEGINSKDTKISIFVDPDSSNPVSVKTELLNGTKKISGNIECKFALGMGSVFYILDGISGDFPTAESAEQIRTSEGEYQATAMMRFRTLSCSENPTPENCFYKGGTISRP